LRRSSPRSNASLRRGRVSGARSSWARTAAPTGECWAEPAAGPQAGPTLVAMLYSANPIPTSSVVLRRRALEAAGGFASPVTLAGDWDWDLWLRLAARGETFVCVPDAVVHYRRHPDGLTADVAALARFQLALHEAHADLVDEATRERVRRQAEAGPRARARNYAFANRRTSINAFTHIRATSRRTRWSVLTRSCAGRSILPGAATGLPSHPCGRR